MVQVQLPEQHKEDLLRLKSALPFRLCYGAYNPQSQDFALFSSYAKPYKKIKKLIERGYLVFLAQ